MTVPMATCPTCDTPLVGTFAWTGYEWICLGCGRLATYFGAKPAEPTPELDARYEELKTEWAEIAPNLISGGLMLGDCSICSTTHAPHWNHASDEEIQRHKDTLASLAERFKVVA